MPPPTSRVKNTTLILAPFLITRHTKSGNKLWHQLHCSSIRPHSLVVTTLDFESKSPSSNLGGAFFVSI
jgi:hypothetical protein